MTLEKERPPLEKLVAINRDWMNQNVHLLSPRAEDHHLVIFLRSMVSSIAGEPKTLSWLDVGCGLGHASLALDARRYVGIDFSPAALMRAREFFPSLEFIEADATSLPFPEKSFDRVLALGLLPQLPSEHLPRFLMETSRVLAPDGWAMFQWPICFEDGWMKFPEIDGGWWFTSYDPEEIREAALAANFPVAAQWVDGDYCWTLLKKTSAP